MTFKEYSDFCKSLWLETPNDLDHVFLGIAGEMGEIAGKLKKYHRGDFDHEALREMLIPELGDVWYYLTRTAEILGKDIDISEDEKGSYKGTWDNTLRIIGDSYDYIADLGMDLRVYKANPNADIFSKYHGETVHVTSELGVEIDLISMSLRALGEQFAIPLQTVLEANRKKLASRHARGVLQGSGDDR